MSGWKPYGRITGRVVEAHLADPTATAAQIAERLRLKPQQVYDVKHNTGLPIPRGRPGRKAVRSCR